MSQVKKVGRLKCPQCGDEMTVYKREDHAFWPEGILEIIMRCQNCDYKSVDVFPMGEKQPEKHSLKVINEDDLAVRVVKSSRAVVKIPELGVKIEPGALSQGYITNVEGILDRIEDVLESRRKKKEAQKLLKRIKSIRDRVSESFTLVIEDPSGCSLIISEKVKKSKL